MATTPNVPKMVVPVRSPQRSLDGSPRRSSGLARTWSLMPLAHRASAALDMAARAIRSGRLPMALVGGASYSQELSVILFAQSRALSPNGTYPFDRRADGFAGF